MRNSLPKRREDEDAFQAALRGEDSMGMVVRAHIHLEVCLNELIEVLVSDPSSISKMELNYSQKVHLATALGLNPQFRPALQAMGSLRNTFAHNVNARLGRQEVNNLYRALCEDAKQIMLSSYDETRRKAAEQALQPYRQLAVKDQFILIAVCLRALLHFATTKAANERGA